MLLQEIRTRYPSTDNTYTDYISTYEAEHMEY